LPVESGDLPVLSPDSTVGTPDSTVGTPDSTVGTPDSTVGTPDSTVGTPDSAEKRRLFDLFDSRRATTVLVSLVVVLAVAAGGLFAWDQVSDDAPTKPSKQPVVVSRDDATAAVDAAAKAAQTILTRTYQDYDKQIDDATALMTDAYAKKFRLTADDVEDQFVAAKTDQQVRMVAQGVVHATRTEVQALLFMNYYVSKDGGDTTYTPYRVLVTVVHTDRGWLVSDIDTK
jgi:Mce-associated membrane protein